MTMPARRAPAILRRGGSSFSLKYGEERTKPATPRPGWSPQLRGDEAPLAVPHHEDLPPAGAGPHVRHEGIGVPQIVGEGVDVPAPAVGLAVSAEVDERASRSRPAPARR